MAEKICDISGVSEAAEVENSLPYGVYEIKCLMSGPQTPDTLQQLADVLATNGIDVDTVSQYQEGDNYYISVKYTRHAPSVKIAFLPAAVIPLIGFVIVAGMVGVGIWKIGDISSAVIKTTLVVGGIAIALVALLRRPLEKAVERL